MLWLLKTSLAFKVTNPGINHLEIQHNLTSKEIKTVKQKRTKKNYAEDFFPGPRLTTELQN